MAVIKSGATSDQLTIDPLSKAARFSEYSLAGTYVGESPTYRVVLKGITPVGSATAPMLVLQGSATKTVRLIRARYAATAATGATGDLWLAKFTTISGGTGVTQTVAKADSNDANATAVGTSYSVVPTTATLADNYWTSVRYETITASVAVPIQVQDFEFGGANEEKPLVLNGTGQYLGLGNSTPGTTPVADIMIEWVEY